MSFTASHAAAASRQEREQDSRWIILIDPYVPVLLHAASTELFSATCWCEYGSCLYAVPDEPRVVANFICFIERPPPSFWAELNQPRTSLFRLRAFSII